MARFSEEEVETLLALVDLEIREVIESGVYNSEDIYLPYLRTLADKLEQYYIKHYPEDENESIFEK